MWHKKLYRTGTDDCFISSTYCSLVYRSFPAKNSFFQLFVGGDVKHIFNLGLTSLYNILKSMPIQTKLFPDYPPPLFTFFILLQSLSSRAVLVVKWSACSPYTPTIRVRIPLKPAVFHVKFVFEKNEN